MDVHLEHRAAGIDEAKMNRLEAEAGKLQNELWALLISDARSYPEASRLRLVTPALNAMIDDAASHLAAKENRLPDAIFYYLFILIVVAGVVVAYRPREEERNVVLWGMFIVVLSGVLMILVDLDRPRRGLIQTSTAPFLRLRESMQVAPP